MHAFRFTKFILGILGLLIGNIRFQIRTYVFRVSAPGCESVVCHANPLLANMSTTSCFSDCGASPHCPFLCFGCMLFCDSENVMNYFCRVQSSGLEMLSLHEVLHPSSFLTFPWPRKLGVLTFSQTCLMVIPC